MTHLKIVLVAPSFYPRVGGVELYVLNLARQFVSRKHEVHVLTPDSVMGQKILPKEENLDGIRVQRIRTLFDLSYRLKFWPDLKRKIMNVAPDLVHVYSHDSYSWFAVSACNEKNIPILITTYGPFKGQSESGRVASLMLSLYDSLITPRIVKDVAAVNIRYPELSSWVSYLGVPDGRINLEPSCIPNEYLERGNSDEFRSVMGIDSKIVLYVGRLSKQKGVHHLIKAASIVHDQIGTVHFVLMGPSYKDIKLDGLPTWIHILPTTTSATIEKNIISAADLFVMPSKYEGFSQAVMKAIAQGKMVIASNVGGLPYEIGYGKYGRLVPYGNEKILANAITEGLTRESNVDTRGLRQYASQFTFDERAGHLESQYHDMVGSIS